jgi:phage baseplate assembly protein W
MATETTKDITGTGWAFPIQIDRRRGGIMLSKGGGGIDEAIRVILGTARGERRMRPNFGCDIHTLIFAPNNASTWGLAAHYVEEALGWWEPRIEVLDVDPQPDPDNPACMNIYINYRIKVTNDKRSIVYPFYLMGRT